MTTLAIDLGTARVAFSFEDDHGGLLPPNPFRPQVQDSLNPGNARRQVWANRAFGGLVTGLTDASPQADIHRDGTDGYRYCCLYTKYTSIQVNGREYVLPYLSPGHGEIPPHAGLPTTIHPAFSNAFTSLKNNPGQFGALLNALIQAATPPGQGLITYVMGCSAGDRPAAQIGGIVIDPRNVYNEAIAVVYALASAGLVPGLDTEHGATAVVADLGGGFLDLALVTDLRRVVDQAARKPANVEGRIINYGGYPLGVDRTNPSTRFSETPLQNGAQKSAYIALMTQVIAYHILSFRQEAPTAPWPTIVSLGGGMLRLGEGAEQALCDGVSRLVGEELSLVTVGGDTKQLTLQGLHLLHRSNFAPTNAGVDLSRAAFDFNRWQRLIGGRTFPANTWQAWAGAAFLAIFNATNSRTTPPPPPAA